MRLAGHVVRTGRGEDYTGFWWGNRMETNDLVDPCIEGRIILKWIFRKWNGAMNWIDLAQNRDTWRALVNAIINHRLP
jgi:hypothetical protein